MYDKYSEKYDVSAEDIESSVKPAFDKVPAGKYVAKIESAGMEERTNASTGEEYLQAKITFNIEGAEEDKWMGRKLFWSSGLGEYIHPSDPSKNLSPSQKVGMGIRFLKQIDDELGQIYHDKIHEAVLEGKKMGDVYQIFADALIAFEDQAKMVDVDVSYKPNSDYPTIKIINVEE